MKWFCESLRQRNKRKYETMKIINFKRKKMKLLIKEQQESHKDSKICSIYKEKFENK